MVLGKLGVALRKFSWSYTHKYCPKNQRIILKSIIPQGWGTSKLGVEAQRNLVVVPKVGEKGVALKVG